ncbi:hypothetical protein [Kineococcus sp. SYSU DK001]|uniref:hypothetical protein n=1 Tax=Kineococcus sp. SYSU DK001 TaxID=3383122 RepID=UPI003D7EDA26
MDLTDVLDDLYGSPPAEFTATRDAYARQARDEGDRDLAARIGGLRKPPVPAWAVNLLRRERPGDVEQLLELGAAMREATASLAGPELRELTVRRHEVLEALRVQAARLTRAAGVRLSPEAGEKVVATLRAGMSDPAAADAVRSGTLVRPLEATGFGGVDVEGATAADAPPTRAAAPAARRARVPRDELTARRQEKAARAAERERAEAERRERERAELAAAVEAAREELREARDEAASTSGDLASARRRHGDLTRRRDDLRARLDAVSEQLSAAGEDLRGAERAAHAADERVGAAERELEDLRARLPD